MFNEHFSICRENFSFSKKSQKFPGFFSQNQFSKFQNQYFSMRFFLNLIYAFAVSQRAHFKPCSATASSRKRPVPKICTRMSRILGIWGSSSLDRLLSRPPKVPLKPPDSSVSARKKPFKGNLLVADLSVCTMNW